MISISSHHPPPSDAPLEDPVVVFHKDHELNPTGTNAGAEMSTLQLVRALKRIGENVYLVADLPDPFVESLDSDTMKGKEGITYISLTPQFHTGRAFRTLRERFKLTRYHLITTSRVQALLESRGEPAVRSRLLITHEQSPHDLGVAPKVIEKVADKLVCVSYAQREAFLAEGCDPDAMPVMRYGVQGEVFKPAPAAGRDYKKLIFIGALVYDKGIHLLVEAFKQLQSEVPGISLEVYGSSKLWGREDYFDLNEAAKIPGITFHGAVSQPELGNALRTAGLLVVPSVHLDPCPLVVYDAQNCGVPVLASVHGGMKEIIKDGVTGAILPHVGVEVLAAKIRELITEPNRLRKMSEACLREISGKYTWERTAENVRGWIKETTGDNA